MPNGSEMRKKSEERTICINPKPLLQELACRLKADGPVKAGGSLTRD